MPRIPTGQAKPKAQASSYVAVHSVSTDKWYIGFAATASGCRVDCHEDLEDLEVYSATFSNPSNPWSSTMKVGKLLPNCYPRYS